MTANRKQTRKDRHEDYDGFVEKFKPKLTTDDCYTPAPVYKAVKEWVAENIMPLDGVPVVRPFWPGGDFESYDYPEGCVVIDNPPFSIMAKIRRFFHARGIKYFLFAPALTLVNSAKELANESCYIVSHCNVTYENGAVVCTSFVTNLDCGGTGVWLAGDLFKKIEAVNEACKVSAENPVYDYPDNVITPARLGKIAVRGITMRIPKDHAHAVSSLDAMRPKSIYGGGWLISEKAAAEKAAARDRFYWPLSDREKEIVRGLGSAPPPEN